MNHSAAVTQVYPEDYYTPGVRRVTSKLQEMGIEVPPAAVSAPIHRGIGNPFVELTKIELALLDWFVDRDSDQAQALVSPRLTTTRKDWHVIEVLDDDRCPAEISSGMLCPSLLDAIGAVIDASDRDVVRLDSCRKDGADIVVVIGGGCDVARIQPVRLEPFDLTVRDRVRTAFKGAREYDVPFVISRAARLPGFSKVLKRGEENVSEGTASGCMLFGFPTNWAFAMRNALKQVDIVVTQSQAQELCAVFFGAGSWHQLVKHQNEPDHSTPPVAVGFRDENGTWQRRFYHTPEEAVFATGRLVQDLNETAAVSLNHISLTIDRKRIYCGFAKKAEMDALSPMDLCENWIESGGNDYWDMATKGSAGINIAAQELLGKLNAAGNGATSAAGVIYPGSGDRELLEGLLGRSGIPPKQIVYIGDCALAVSYVDDPDGRNMLAANLQVFKFTESGTHKLKGGDIAMYKAVVRVVEKPGCPYLVIRGDYGNHDPIEIPINDWGRVEQLASMTHGEGMFALEPFDLGGGRPYGTGKQH